MKRLFEIVSARLYYGPHARGSVLLRNGSIVIHLSSKRKIQNFLKGYLNDAS